ncbi:MAG: DUF4383 domain-containing protein [Acidobacteria bacterium]|nr:DUF4383 domain-containing protein [Acidobacteriota bacterium]
MAKTVALILGIGFLGVALVGFFAPTFLGMHLSLTHTIIHLVTGIVSVYFGTAASLKGAKGFCIAFGAVYALLGIAGFLFGAPQPPAVPGPTDANILKVIPGYFEVGSSDHVVHILLGGIYLLGGFMTRVTRETHRHAATTPSPAGGPPPEDS